MYLENNNSAENKNSNTVNTKRTLKDIFKIMISNILILLSGVMVGFLLPKIIDKVNYGYYRTFTLYLGYLGLFQFGFVDGIYLIYGGYNFNELKPEKFRLFFKILLLIEFIVFLIVLSFALFIVEGEYKYIFLCVAIDIILTNIIVYFQKISQITRKFNELSIRNIIQAILTIVSISSLFIIYKISNNLLSYKIYVTLYLIIHFLLTIWYVITYKIIIFGKSEKLAENSSTIKKIFIYGMPLTISSLVSSLILNFDRQFVSLKFTPEEYASYAFAYSLLALITTATSSISTVIFPLMKRLNINELNKRIDSFISLILVFASICLLVYFPLELIIEGFLPKYLDSLEIFKVILPGFLISTPITIIIHNFYKILNKNGFYFCISVIILILSIFANIVSYIFFGNMLSISIASIIVMFIWLVISYLYFVFKFNCKWVKNVLFIIMIIASFYVTVFCFDNIVIEFVLYFISLLIMIIIFYHNDIRYFIKRRNNI